MQNMRGPMNSSDLKVFFKKCVYHSKLTRKYIFLKCQKFRVKIQEIASKIAPFNDAILVEFIE